MKGKCKCKCVKKWKAYNVGEIALYRIPLDLVDKLQVGPYSITVSEFIEHFQKINE
jgi:hypothetical protein